MRGEEKHWEGHDKGGSTYIPFYFEYSLAVWHLDCHDIESGLDFHGLSPWYMYQALPSYHTSSMVSSGLS
jgi:hypothetical protein